MLQLRQRQTVEEGTENWDDEDFDIGGDSDFIFPSRATSVATTATGGFNLSTRRDHRDSITSRLSMRSDCEDDDESQVQVPGDDERSKNDAIAAATRAGIPIPQNIPASALLGGTIKRLGGRKVKKVVQQDDWDDDLELPALGKGVLTLKCHDPSEYPDALRHVSGPNSSSPIKKIGIPPTPEGEKDDETDIYATIKPTRSVQASILDRFRDNDDDDDMFGRGGETLKVTKRRMPKPMTLIQPPSPVKGQEKPDDYFVSDLQLPHNKPLRLSIGRDIPAGKDVPNTPTISQDDFDEWGEGSLGTRFGGTRRSIGRSNSRSARSSSATMSPSISSSVTFESEDEGLDGIEIPTGPLDFGGLLKRRREMQIPEEPPFPPKPAPPTPKRPAAPPRLSSRDDFLSGLEIGDDDVFSKKLTLNRNIKVKTVRQTSPQRPKTVATLKFTDKPTAAAPVTSRLPRPLGHERHTSSLDPVSETAAPTTTRGIKRSQSKLGGGFHTPNTSISSIPTPQGTPTSSANNSQMPPPSTPRRRALDAKPSFASLRNEPTTTSAQLLKVKRSMPIIRNTNSPAKPINSRYERPTSRNEATPASTRPIPTGRKTPNESQSDRSGAESGMGGTLRRKPPPFLAGGSSAAQSHHITVKTSRHFRQNDSMSSNVSGEGYRSTSRTMSRAGLRSPSPAGQKSYATTGSMRLRGPEALAREAASKRQITKPTKRQHFGDGRELDGFDDLPTSSSIEQKYIKQPVARGPPKTLRNKVYNSGSSTIPTPVTSSPARNENRTEPTLPRFARDTNASRMAREQVISQRHPSSGNPLGTLTNQWKAQVTAKTGLQPLNTNTLRPKKPRQPVQKRPHLIKPMNDVAKIPKSVKGMTYNPITFKWEGNENDPALNPFDALPSPQKVAPALPDANAAPPPHVFREKENTTPRPALITNINASQGVQIVGGMVFDPQRMCWLKVPSKRGQSLTRGSLGGKCDDKDTLDGFEAFGIDEDDEEDVFKDVPDLEDRPTALTPTQGDFSNVKSRTSGFGASEGGLKDEWLVGEEFDVGPEFVRRQREEEERWRRKVEKWVGTERERGGGEEWRWGIRDVVGELGP